MHTNIHTYTHTPTCICLHAKTYTGADAGT